MAKKAATEVFSQWALIGKDEGMERGHAASVKAMLELALPKVNQIFQQLIWVAVMAGLSVCYQKWVHLMLKVLTVQSR